MVPFELLMLSLADAKRTRFLSIGGALPDTDFFVGGAAYIRSTSGGRGQESGIL